MTVREFFRSVIAGFGAVFVIACSTADAETRESPAPSASAALPAEIDALTRTAQASAPYAGLAVSVRRGDAVVYEAGYGVANLATGEPITPETAFKIGSITKSFTALVIAQLAVEGRIDLDAPISQYLPDFSGPARDVAVRRLMNHTSGLLNYVQAPGFPLQSEADFTQDDIRNYFEDAPLMFEPGAAFSYSNSGYYLLGIIIETVTGEPYQAAVEDRIIIPLGLQRTFPGAAWAQLSNRAVGYTPTPDGFQPAIDWSPSLPFSAGELISSVQDVSAYLRAVYRDGAFGADVAEILTTHESLTSGFELDYTLGAVIERDWNGLRKISHGGDVEGFTSYMAYYPDEDVSIVVSANTRGVYPDPVGLEQKIARLLFDLPTPTPSGETLDEAEIAALTGDYSPGAMRIGGIDRIGFAPAEGTVALVFGGMDSPAPAIPLIHIEGRTFMAAHDDEMMFTFTPEAGRAHSVAIDWLGGVLPFERAQ